MQIKLHILTFFRFVLFDNLIIVISVILLVLGTLLYILSRLMLNSTLKSVLRNIGNSLRNQEKSFKITNKNEFKQKKYFFKFNSIINKKKILCIFRDIDKNIMRKFLFFKGFSSIS